MADQGRARYSRVQNHSKSFKDRQRQLCNQRKWCIGKQPLYAAITGYTWLQVVTSGHKWLKISAVQDASLMLLLCVQLNRGVG